MASITQNSKVREFIIRSIMIFMMNYQSLFCLFAKETKSWIFFVSKFSVGTYSSFISRRILSCWPIFITTCDRTVFFFRMSNSGGFKGKIFIAKFALSSNKVTQFHHFVSTFWRTTYSFRSFYSMGHNLKRFLTSRTIKRNFFYFERICTNPTAKKILTSFNLVGVNTERFFTKRTFDFHIRYGSSQEVLCLV